VIQITGEDELLITTERGQISRIPASEIRRVGRASLGVRIMNLNKNDRITGVAKLIKVEEEGGNSDNAETPADVDDAVTPENLQAPETAGEDNQPEA